MIIYRDALNHDDLMFGAHVKNLVDGVAYECDCNFVTARQPRSINDDEIEEVQVIDAVHAFGYRPVEPDKKDYTIYFGNYTKRLNDFLKSQGTSATEMKAFQTGILSYHKKITDNFSKFSFYVSQNGFLDGEHMIIPISKREDGTTPYVVLWKHGIKEGEEMNN